MSIPKKLQVEIDLRVKECRGLLDSFDLKWRETRSLNQLSVGASLDEKGRSKKKIGHKPQAGEDTDYKLIQDSIARLKLEMEATLRRLYRTRQMMTDWLNNVDLRHSVNLAVTLADLKKEIENRTRRGKEYFVKGVSSENVDESQLRPQSSTEEWLANFMGTLAEQLDLFQAEIESVKTPIARRDQLSAMVELHSMHIDRLNFILRGIRNLAINLKGRAIGTMDDDECDSPLEALKEILQNYIFRNSELSIVAADDIYDEIELNFSSVDNVDLSRSPPARENIPKPTPETDPAKASPSEAKPYRSEAKPYRSEAKPYPSEAKASPSEARWSPSEAKASPSEARCSSSDAKASPSEAKASPSEARASPSESKASPSESKASPSESKASPSEAKPGPSEAKPYRSEAKASPSEGRWAPSESKWPPSEAKPASVQIGPQFETKPGPSEARWPPSEARWPPSEARWPPLESTPPQPHPRMDFNKSDDCRKPDDPQASGGIRHVNPKRTDSSYSVWRSLEVAGGVGTSGGPVNSPPFADVAAVKNMQKSKIGTFGEPPTPPELGGPPTESRPAVGIPTAGPKSANLFPATGTSVTNNPNKSPRLAECNFSLHPGVVQAGNATCDRRWSLLIKVERDKTEKLVCIRDWQGLDSNMLSLKELDVVEVLVSSNVLGWCFGRRLASRERVGWFPSCLLRRERPAGASHIMSFDFV